MPELPEVETVVRALRAHGLVGAVIAGVSIGWPRMVKPLTPFAFARRLQGRRIESIGRRAKHIVIRLSGGDSLFVHLRMTGQLHFAEPGMPRDPHEHVSLRLEDGRELRFHDTRKFGRWILTDRPESVLGGLGPEPLGRMFRPALFRQALRERRRRLKPLLLDQSFVAGLGNIYVDEALWESRLHPARSSHTLTVAEAGRLFRAIRAVLARAIRLGGTTLGPGQGNFYSVGGRRGRNQDGLKVFRRAGAPCPRCGGIILRIVVGQRGTHLCPACQRPDRDAPA